MPTANTILEENIQDEHTTSKRLLAYETIGLTLIFFLALAIRLWFNFASFHINAYASCDAWEYLTDAKALSHLGAFPISFWIAAGNYIFGGTSIATQNMIHNSLTTLTGLHQSGAIFPLFLSASYLLFHVPVEPTNWVPPVMLQSIISALSCVFIALSAKLAWNRSTGLIAGIIAATYPAFVINSGRLYSETFACFLTCLLVWWTIRGFKENHNGLFSIFLLGVTATALQMTRSIMSVVSLALIPIIAIQQRRHKCLMSVCMLIFGMIVCMAPWLALQKMIFGSASLIVDRVGHYNFFTGNHVDTQGWLSFPYPDGRGIENESIIKLAKESYQRSPSRWFKLLLDKPARLLKFPWNDFRTSLGNLSFYKQVLIHQFILLFAWIGIALGLTVGVTTTPSSRELYSRLFLLGMFAFQFVYMAFITVPRYNLTIMPLIIMFAATGIDSLIYLIRQNKALVPYLVITCALALFAVEQLDLFSVINKTYVANHLLVCLIADCLIKFFITAAFIYTLFKSINSLHGNRVQARFAALLCGALAFSSLCLPVRANGRWYEWHENLNSKNQQLIQHIELPPSTINSLKSKQAYLMIDSDGLAPIGSNLAININGKPITGPLIPSLSLVEDFSHFERHGGNDLFLACEYIFDCLTNPAGITNLDLRQWFLIPLPQDAVSSNKLQIQISKLNNSNTTFFGGYQVDPHSLEIPSATLYSWEKAFYGVENSHGFTDTRYDTKLSLSSPQTQANYFIRLLVSPSSDAKTLATIAVVPKPLTVTYPKSAIQEVEKLPSFAPKSIWLIRISGQAKSNQNNSEPAMIIKFLSQDDHSNQFTYTSPWSIRKIPTHTNWTNFDYAFPLNPNAFPGKLKRIEISLYAFDPLQPIINTPHNWQPQSDFKNINIEIENLPSLPFSPGYKIY